MKLSRFGKIMETIDLHESSSNLKKSYFSRNDNKEIIKQELIRALELNKNHKLYKWIDSDALDVRSIDFDKWNKIMNEINRLQGSKSKPNLEGTKKLIETQKILTELSHFLVFRQ